MSKEELERSIAQEHASSAPPRAASEPPRTLPPSVPPSTDEIDTDWGAEQESAPAAPASATPIASASEPPPQRISVAPAAPKPISVAPPAPTAATPPRSAPPPAPAAVRERPMRSQTLIGMSPPTRAQSAPPPSPSTPPPDVADPPPDGMRAVHEAAHEAAPVTVQQRPMRSRTLIGLPPPTPPVQTAPFEATPSGAATPSSPPPPAGALERPATVPPAAPSVRPAAPSVRPPMPPARSSDTLPFSKTTVGATPRAKQNSSPVIDTPAPAAAPGFGRWLVVLAAAVAVVAFIGYRVLGKPEIAPVPASTASPAALPAVPAPPTAVAVVPPSPEPAASVASTALPAVEPSSAAAPVGAAASGKHRVLLKSLPPKARFFHFGKEVGVAPFVLEFEPGERHAYEVGLPGYGTRKVVVDGSKPEITVGLRKETR